MHMEGSEDSDYLYLAWNVSNVLDHRALQEKKTY